MHISFFSTYNEEILLRNIKLLSGRTIQEVAHFVDYTNVNNMKKNKGFIGHLIEKYLGIQSNNRSQQDFSNIGVELKTIRVNRSYIPLDSTFICSVPLVRDIAIRWKSSRLYNKLHRILWVPIVGEKSTLLKYHYIGEAFFWTPNRLEEKQLKCDWEEFMDLIITGQINTISSQYGEVLQIRLKSKNKNVLTKSINENGEYELIVPRAFYLRKNFTRMIFK